MSSTFLTIKYWQNASVRAVQASNFSLIFSKIQGCHTTGKAEDSFQLWLAGLPVKNYSELNKETQLLAFMANIK